MSVISTRARAHKALAAAAAGAAILGLAACSSSSAGTKSPSAAPAGIVTAKVGEATLVSGDAQLTGQPVARTGGKVAKLANGCMGVVSINGKSTFVVFPAGTTVKGEAIEAPGYGTLEVGKDVTLAGTLFPGGSVPETVKDVPAECQKDADFVFFAKKES